MKAQDVSCPICSADIPVSGDEKPGEDIYCTYCGAPFTVVAKDDEGLLELEDDY